VITAIYARKNTDDSDCDAEARSATPHVARATEPHIRGWTALVGALLLGGCAHGALGPLLPVDPAQAAEIAVIRTTRFVGCATPLPVTVDGHDAYGLACGEHVILTVPSGERIIGVKNWRWFVTDENTIALTVASGGRYYLRLDVSGLGGPALSRITEETGRALIEKTTRLTP
jgi:hypothetical protein